LVALLIEFIDACLKQIYFSSLALGCVLKVFHHAPITYLYVLQDVLILTLDAVEYLHVILVFLHARFLCFSNVALKVKVLFHVLHISELEQLVATLL
jgi:hypothetical protein